MLATFGECHFREVVTSGSLTRVVVEIASVVDLYNMYLVGDPGMWAKLIKYYQ